MIVEQHLIKTKCNTTISNFILHIRLFMLLLHLGDTAVTTAKVFLIIVDWLYQTIDSNPRTQ